MQLMKLPDYGALSGESARQIATDIVTKPDLSLLPAAGNTMVGPYRELVRIREGGGFDPSWLTMFQLDEYLGLPPDDDRTLWGWMERIFVAPLRIASERTVRLCCDTVDAAATCKAYDAAVERVGGFDLAILGLGMNGHLGFNEPPADDMTVTREVVLSEESLVSNSAYWGGRERVPLRAMTAGMRQILGSKRILLLVSGKKKRDILHKIMNGPVTSDVPASYLQLHSNTLVIADEDAVG